MKKAGKRFGRAACAAAMSGLLALGGCGVLGAEKADKALRDVDMVAMPESAELAGGLTTGETAALLEPDGWYEPDWPADPFNTEEYAAIDEGGFVSTRTRPLSTLSADVDTASYCNLRRMAREGMGLDEVPAGAVRIEEMLNYFDYRYALPGAGELFAQTVRAGTCPWNPGTLLLVMGFATAPEPTAAADAGRNLVFLIDVSGSMDEPDKLPLLQDSFARLTEQLDERDRVSIVTYASGEEVVLDGASGDETARIMRAVHRLRAEGATNGEAGLRMAYDVARANFIEGGVNRIILASDGDLNVGMTSDSDLKDYVAAQRESGIYLSVLGFGQGNYKDGKMETIADNGNGQYHYIDCLDEACKVFGEDLCANLEPLADDVKLQVEFNPAQVKAYRLIGYENRGLADEDFRDDARDAGDVGPGHQFTVAYEVVLQDSAFDVAEPELKYAAGTADAAASDEWLTAHLRYREAASGRMGERSFAVGAADATADPGGDWRFAAAVIEYGMIARGSEYRGDADLASVDALLAGCELTEAQRGFADLVRATRLF